MIAWTINGEYTAATRVADPLVGGIPASNRGRHGGCRLRFGPQGYLWIATGDGVSATAPQDLTLLGGKVLRVDASTGAGAPTNPFASSPRVYTYGHRNVQGLALRPGTSQMWSVEHGPRVDDEINLLAPGGNYGWDPVRGSPPPNHDDNVPMTDLAKFPDAVEAKWSSGESSLATSGGIFLEGAQWGIWEGRLAVATLRDSKLRLFEFTPDGAFVSQVIVAALNGTYGRLRTPMMGPDGALYVTTSNGPRKDHILRVAPGTRPPPPPPPPPLGGGGGFGGGGGAPRTRAPSEPINLTAAGGDGQVVLTWDAPEDDGGSPITDYEYRIDRSNPWISTGSTDTTHTVSGLVNDTTYLFEVRAVNNAGKSFPSRRVEATPEAPQVFTLDFPHFANGGGVTSEVVLLNVGTTPVRPVLYFSDQQGDPIAADSVVEVTGDLEVQDDGGLTVQTAIEPLGELTVATHGRGEQLSGSVRVVAEGAPIGGVLRYGVPEVGVTGVGTRCAGAGRAVPGAEEAGRDPHGGGDAQPGRGSDRGDVPADERRRGARRGGDRSGGQRAAVVVHRRGVRDDRHDGLHRNGALHGAAGGQYAGLAVEVDQANRIFTTLPVVAVDRTGGSDGETVLDFPHFANGTWFTDLVFVNPSIEASRPPLSPFHRVILASRPEIYFHDTEGALVPPASLVDLTDDLEVTEDGALTVRDAMEPMGVITISTHGRGELLTGSVRVVSEGPLGGMLRFAHPSLGAAGVAAGLEVGDALVPVRRIDGGITTGIALHNLDSSAGLVRCELLRRGVLLDTASLPLAANGQTSWSIDQAFPATDTSDFTGSLRCAATAGGSFSAVALEIDPGARTFTTLPVVPVPEMPSRE